MRARRLSLIGATIILACLDAALVTGLLLDRARAAASVRQNAEISPQGEVLQRKAGEAKIATPDVPAHTVQPLEVPAAKAAAESLLRLSQPGPRATAIEASKSELRRYHVGLARELRLSPAESEAVFDILAEQAVRIEERSYRKRMAGADGWQDRNVLDADTLARLRGLLGASRIERFLHYRDYLPERHSVADLRSRLRTAEALGATEAAQLTEVLRDERRHLTATLTPFGKAIRYESGYPEHARRYGRDRAAQLKFDEEHIARLAEHYSRIRDRAAVFLTPQQMRRLEEQHEGVLVEKRAFLMLTRRVDEEVEALRRQAAVP